MHRIDTPSAQKDKFGVGKNGFTRGNPQTGTAATKLDNDYFDSIQEEICGVIESAGIALDKTKRTQLAESINKLIGNSKAPAASTTMAGIVQLNSSVNSTAENQAATPKAVKTAYDLANTANTTANKAKSTAETDASTTVKGRVQLNSAVNSTLENQAATPKAVKTAYDLANGRLPLTGGTVTGNTNFTGKLQQAGKDVITTGNVVSYIGKSYVTETYRSSDGTSWYRKWSDGFIEQAGQISTGASTVINFLTPFSLKPNVQVSGGDASGDWAWVDLNTLTTTSVTIGGRGTSNYSTKPVNWVAFGK